MSFEQKIPEHIKEQRQKAKQLYWDRDRLVHHCDCEYCEYDGVDDDNQPEWDRLTAELAEVDKTIEKLKEHAKRHGIEVPA